MNIDTQEIIEWSPNEMLEVQLSEPDDFLKIKETLTRIGVSSKRDYNTLYQSCHILHKQGRYFIVHFKELFMLDGKPSTFIADDRNRRNTIAILLSDWGLMTILHKIESSATTDLKMIKIISHRDKKDWNLVSKYTIGNVKRR
jgi:hypothetical protein